MLGVEPAGHLLCQSILQAHCWQNSWTKPALKVGPKVPSKLQMFCWKVLFCKLLVPDRKFMHQINPFMCALYRSEKESIDQINL